MNELINRVLAALEGVRQVGDGRWSACCPAHDDSTASLSVSSGKDCALVKCHAGCSTADVVSAIGLEMKDLFACPAEHNGHHAAGKAKIVAYDYRDTEGDLVFQAVRMEPKDFRQRRPDGNGGWLWNTKGCPIIPYRLPELLAADSETIVFVVEGEKDVDRLCSQGMIATCNVGGAGKWKPEHAEHLTGRHVVILPDHDDAGHKHANQVAQSLKVVAASVKRIELPDLPPKGDVSDWLDAGGTADKLVALVVACDEWQPAGESKPTKTTKQSHEETEHKSQATLLVELASQCDLFHDPDGEAYARFPVGDHDELHWEAARIRNRRFRRWLSRRFYQSLSKTPSAQSLQDALGVIEGKAIYDGDRRPAHVRVAGNDDKIYLDLGNERWQAVEIDAQGWRVIDDPPVMFRRAKAVLPLPLPAGQGDIEQLRRFVNVTDDDWPLLLAWLVAAMRPTGPYPVLAVYGEHGSAKSTLCRYVRSTTDPNTAPLRADYREPRDLMICATSGWVIALDNLSTIQPWLSDCLCRLSTGGGFSTRTLYENDEETIFDAKRPVILNCIEEVVTRSDLLDRCVLLNLPRIDADQRISESQLDHEFDAALPGILGGLLTAVSTAMRNAESVKLPTLPRMADFAIWATAAEPALGLQPGDFLQAYTANRAAGNETAIEASPVGRALVEFVIEVVKWSGTSTDLLEELDHRADQKTKLLKSWPKTARTLGAAVKRLAPNLREMGVGVDGGRQGKQRTRMIALTYRPERSGNFASASSASSATSETPGNSPFQADAKADATERPPNPASAPPSAKKPLFPEENGMADMADKADAKIPTHSSDPQWCEI